MGGSVVVDRSLCARPVLRERLAAEAGGKREKYVSPCGQPATVIASEDSGFTWAYCPWHAQQEAAVLELEIGIDIASRVLAADKRQKLDALRIALEIS